MNILCKSSHSRRELLFVFNDNLCGIVSVDLPTIVNIDVNIPFFIKAKLNNFVSSFFNDCLIDVTIEMVPTVPSHLRCFTQTIVDGIAEPEKYTYNCNPEDEILFFLELKISYKKMLTLHNDVMINLCLGIKENWVL